MLVGSGKLRNDVWVGQLTSGSQSSWTIDDRYLHTENGYNPELMRSNMRWREVTPGRVAPPTWPNGPKYSLPMTNDDWIACQDSIKKRLAYTTALPDPSVCKDPPQFCYDHTNARGCHAQGMWKRENMWSPRRGLGAASANGKIFVIGGQAREYGRIDDSRLIGGLGGQKRIETVKDHSTIQEDLVLKNDVWSSDDRGATWELVSPGCKDPQEDALMQTELWSRNHSNPLLPKFVGSIGSKCVDSSNCYGVAECKVLGNTLDKVCVCPMFSPRMHHSVTVQRRFSMDKDNVVFTEDVMYVVGGFISVKQAFCANRSCGPTDGYRLAVDDAWMSTDGKTWIQIKPAFSKNGSFRGRGSHSAVIAYGNSIVRNNTGNPFEKRDSLLIFGGETFHPNEKSTVYLNDVWRIDLPKAPCCIPSQGCEDWSIQNKACLPNQNDWKIVSYKSKWSARSGHSTVYEPRSLRNSFTHRIYLIGGINSEGVQSDIWTWNLTSDEWQCDFCPNAGAENDTAAYLSIDSLLSEIKQLHLPSIGDGGDLINFTTPSITTAVNANAIALMALKGVNTIMDLASADLYSVLNLRGYTFPGSHARPVVDVCYLRAISIAIVNKCTTTRSATPLLNKNDLQHIYQPLNSHPSTTCGRGGESEPCVRGDWDGCTPIPGVSKVDVHGVGDVAVPQTQQNPLSAMEEIFCRQVPSGRYWGAAGFLNGKVVLLGGIGHNPNRLFRDVWARDDSYPQAVITTKPASRSPQSQFYFDNNGADDVAFEFKLVRDDSDIIPWTTTTKMAGANVGWLDDKRGGPGRGWYSLYVRAVKPSGNRDYSFSTQSNVYVWYYIPPIPWGAISGYIIVALVLLSAGYYGYRRRKKRLILEKFQLRRLKRKFKLRAAQQYSNSKVSTERIQKMHRRRSDATSTRSQISSQHHQSVSTHERLEVEPHGQMQTGAHETSNDRPHSRSHRPRSRSMRSDPYEYRESSSNHSIRRRKGNPADGRSGDEARNRRRREREKLRRDMRH